MIGTHAGISIGEDGPSQMALEDIASMRAISGSHVLYPCDAVSTERLVELMAATRGIFYLRGSRPDMPVIYGPEETFELGGAKILKQTGQDVLTVVAAGVTVFEALKAREKSAEQGLPFTVIDAYSIKPLARDLILSASQATRNPGLIITVEDHYSEGGLGDTVAGELSRDGARVHNLAVIALPHSGKKDELMTRFGIDSQAILTLVRELAAQGPVSLAKPA
jgi:transketolase